jgi:hypothetical protein
MELDSYIDAFFTTTYSQADARRRLNLLETAIEQSLFGQANARELQSVLAESSVSEFDKQSLTSFVTKSKLPADPVVLKKIITGIRDAILARPVVTLTLSLEPSPEQVTMYGVWFRKNVNPKILMTFLFSANVIGGCSIAWQGKQVTYDLAYMIKQKRNEILAVMDKYVLIKKRERII